MRAKLRTIFLPRLVIRTQRVFIRHQAGMITDLMSQVVLLKRRLISEGEPT